MNATSDQSAFLANIIQNPDDDTVRLIFADWLEEKTDWGAAWAEYIRKEIRGQPHGITANFEWGMSIIGRMSRGFLFSVECTAENWLRHADVLAWHPSQNRPCPETAQPIREVVLTTMPVTQTMEVTHSGNRLRYENKEWVDIDFDYADTQSIDHLQRVIHDQMLRSYWPGIKFTLPSPFIQHVSRVEISVEAGGDIREGALVCSDDQGRVVEAIADTGLVIGAALENGRIGQFIRVDSTTTSGNDFYDWNENENDWYDPDQQPVDANYIQDQ